MMNKIDRLRQSFPVLLPLIAFVAALLTFILAEFAQPLFLSYFQRCESDPILAELKTGYYSNTCVFYSMYCMSLVYVGIYTAALFFANVRRRRFMSAPAPDSTPFAERKALYLSRRAEAKRNHKFWLAGHIVFAALLLGLTFMNKQMLESCSVGMGEDTRLARETFRDDLVNYRAGKFLTYHGPLIWEKYVPPDRGYLRTGKPYYYFTGDVSKSFRLRCPEYNFNGKQLLMPVYDVKYLPRTAYALSIAGPDGRERLGKDWRWDLAPDEWTYGDLVLKKSPGVPGYENLNEGQRRLFDLLNSNILLDNVLQLDHQIYYVQLEDPLTKAECDKVGRLYDRTNARYTQNLPLYSFLFIPDEDGMVSRMQISGKDYGSRVWRLYGPVFRQRAMEIARSLPENSDAREQCRRITEYLLANVSPVEKLGEDGRRRIESKSTGFGALVEGAGNAKGYALAFDAIARYAGLTTQYIAGDGNYMRVTMDENVEYRNAVRLENGRWLEVNVHALAMEKAAGKSAMGPFGGKNKGWTAVRPAGNDRFGYIQVPGDWEETATGEGGELLYRRSGEKSWIRFQALESVAEAFDPVAAAGDIRGGIEAGGGVVYTDYTEYLSQDCHSHLLCAALPDEMFLVSWIYAGADGKGCSLSVYGTSETTAALAKLIQSTFSLDPPG